jgi:hypothetical protein
MHRKYGKDGVVCMSLSIDDKVNTAANLDYLKKQGAAFPNDLLDEEAVEILPAKLGVAAAIPVILVYDRTGKIVGRKEGEKDFTYDDVEKLVRGLLEAKQ